MHVSSPWAQYTDVILLSTGTPLRMIVYADDETGRYGYYDPHTHEFQERQDRIELVFHGSKLLRKAYGFPDLPEPAPAATAPVPPTRQRA